MAKVKQWMRDAAKSILHAGSWPDEWEPEDVSEIAQIIADAEPATGPCPKCQHIHSGQIICGHAVELRGPKAINAELEVKHGDNWKLSDAEKLIAQDGICQCPSATGPTPDALEPEEFIKAAFPDADLDKLEINARIVIKWLREALAYAASKSGATPPTRFDEFDDANHPFRKWWEKHGQFMLSGGGRRESIWAARGWIAREQLAAGVEVTGDSMHEQNAGATPGGEARTQSPIAYLSDKCKCGHSMGEHDFGSTNRKRRYCGSCDCPYWNPVKGAESAPIPPTQPGFSLDVYQQDWSPGFASFMDDGAIAEGAHAHATLNLGSLLCAVKTGDLDKRDLPYLIAESLMHEAIHALEAWANVEFSEDRVEELLTKYREKYDRATIWEYTGAPPSAPKEVAAPIPAEPPEACPACGSNDPAYDTFTHVMPGIVTCPNAWHKLAAPIPVEQTKGEKVG